MAFVSQSLPPQFYILKILVYLYYREVEFCWCLKMFSVLCQRAEQKYGSIFSYSNKSGYLALIVAMFICSNITEYLE